MKHTFKYVQAGLWYRPIIRVALKFNKVEFNYLALIDSGADFNIFHADIAKILKIDLSKLKNPINFSGIKGGGVGHFTSIDLGIEGSFVNTPVIFSDDISDNGYGILGQQGFFNNYKIEFDYRLRKIELTSNKK
jgi:hypothetical protein